MSQHRILEKKRRRTSQTEALNERNAQSHRLREVIDRGPPGRVTTFHYLREPHHTNGGHGSVVDLVFDDAGPILHQVYP
jgi:hypothetical protein